MNYQKEQIAKKTIALFLSTCIGLSASLGSVQASASGQTFAREERVIVLFEEGTTKKEEAEVKKLGEVDHQLKHVDAVSMEVPVYELDELLESPHVKSVERDIPVTISAQRQDWGIGKTKAPQAWSSGLTGKGVKIAVIDTGISTHEDLVIAGGKSLVSYTASYQDDHGHGTHVAGIIGARNNDKGVVGIAPNSSLYAVKVMDQSGSGYLSDVIAGIDWSVANGMDILSMSLGTPQHSYALEEAVNMATQKGVLVLAAAGNDGAAINYPAAYSSVISVSATDSANNIASFSSRGEQAEVAAPGVSILSTYLKNQYAYLSGTSMATPYAAGNLALLKEKNPQMNASELRKELQKSVVDLGTAGRDSLYGYGLIQAPVKMAAQPVKEEPSQTEPDVPQPVEDEVLESPKNLKVTSLTNKTVSLVWDQSPYASAYDISVNGKFLATVQSNQVKIGNLVPNTQYTVGISAKNTVYKSEEGSISIKTKKGTPGKPAHFIASDIKQTSLHLSWAKQAYADYYEIKRNGQLIATTKNLSYVDYALKASSRYTYEIKAVNEEGKSDSAITSATTKMPANKIVLNTRTNAKTYVAGKKVYMSVYAKDATGKILSNASVSAVITQPNKKVIKATGKTNKQGRVIFQIGTSSIVPNGTYKVSAKVTKTRYLSTTSVTSFSLSKASVSKKAGTVTIKAQK